MATRGSEKPQKAGCTGRNKVSIIKFRNNKRNVRSPSQGKRVRCDKKCKTCNLGCITVSMLYTDKGTDRIKPISKAT